MTKETSALEVLKLYGEQRLGVTPPPDRRLESWRYFPIAKVFPFLAAEKRIDVAKGGNTSPSALALFPISHAQLVFLDGVLQPLLSKVEGPLSIKKFSEILSDSNELEFKLATEQEEKFKEQTYLDVHSKAHLHEGYLVRIKKSSKPLELTIIHQVGGVNQASKTSETIKTSKAQDHQIRDLWLIPSRMTIALEEEAELNINEIFVDAEEDAGETLSDELNAHFRLDLKLKRGSKVSLNRVQNVDLKKVIFQDTWVHQEEASAFTLHSLGLGAKISRQQVVIEQTGVAAKSTLKGAYFCREQQYCENRLRVNHLAECGESVILFRGILTDESRAVFNGDVWISKKGQKTQSEQINNNLLLSPQTEIDTKPDLRIDADDVKAKHGATVGQLDEEEMFYLQARAIPPHEAKRLVLSGFVSEIFSDLAEKKRQVALSYLNRVFREGFR